MCPGLHTDCLLFLSKFNRKRNVDKFSTSLEPNIFRKHVQSESSSFVRTDRQTDEQTSRDTDAFEIM